MNVCGKSKTKIGSVCSSARRRLRAGDYLTRRSSYFLFFYIDLFVFGITMKLVAVKMGIDFQDHFTS